MIAKTTAKGSCMSRISAIVAGLSVLATSTAMAIMVTVPEKTAPESITVAPNLVIGPDKALYISDTSGAKIWRLKPGASQAELFLDDRTLTGIDGITFVGDTLYENNVIFNKWCADALRALGRPGESTIMLHNSNEIAS